MSQEKKIDYLQQMLRRMSAIQKEHIQFIKSPEYKRLPEKLEKIRHRKIIKVRCLDVYKIPDKKISNFKGRQEILDQILSKLSSRVKKKKQPQFIWERFG